MASRERRIVIAASLAVPLLLALLSAVQLAGAHRATEYLVLPPLAVIVYLIFREPNGAAAKLRSIVLLPCLGAAIGQACWHFFALTPPGVAIATLAVVILQTALRAYMPPALALAVLAMLLKAHGPWYVLGVLEGTSIIFVAFECWRRFGPMRADYSRALIGTGVKNELHDQTV
jgi:HPP family